jgi:hypothetical protein
MHSWFLDMHVKKGCWAPCSAGRRVVISFILESIRFHLWTNLNFVFVFISISLSVKVSSITFWLSWDATEAVHKWRHAPEGGGVHDFVMVCDGRGGGRFLKCDVTKKNFKRNKKNRWFFICFDYNEAYPSKTKQVCQAEVTQIWRSLKDEKDKDEKLDDMMKKLKSIAMKRKGNMFSFWGNLSQKSEKKVSRQITDVIKRFLVRNSDWIFTRLVSIWWAPGRIPIRRASFYFKRSTGNNYIENEGSRRIKRQINPCQLWLASLTETKRLWYVEWRTRKRI